MKQRVAHWILQSAVAAAGIAMAACALAQAVSPAPAAEAITINTALNVLGLFCVALIGRWSWNQDSAIARAQHTADTAVAEANALRLLLAERHLPKVEAAAAMEAALKPIQTELHHMRSEMAAMRSQATATSAQIIQALVGRRNLEETM